MSDTTLHRCSICGALRPASDLNGGDPFTGDYSRAYCRRLADCSSSQAADVAAAIASEAKAAAPSDDEQNAPLGPPLVAFAAVVRVAIEVPVVVYLERQDSMEAHRQAATEAARITCGSSLEVVALRYVEEDRPLTELAEYLAGIAEHDRPTTHNAGHALRGALVGLSGRVQA